MLHLTELLLNFYFHIFAQYYAYFNIRFEVQRQCSSDNAAEESSSVFSLIRMRWLLSARACKQ